MNTLEVLTKARALVDKGWMRGGWYHVGKNGQVERVCAAGAIRLAARQETPSIVVCSCGCGGGLGDFGPTALSIQTEQALGDVIGTGWESIPEWNDVSHRTKEEVLAAFDEAIKRLTPPPPEPVFEGPIVAIPTPVFGETKVTYTLIPNVHYVFADTPTYVPDEFTKELVSTA